MSDLDKEKEKLDGLYQKMLGPQTYSVKYVHKISSSAKDVGPDVTLPGGAFSDSKTLGKALRKAGVLTSGGKVTNFRVEGNRVIIFPSVPGMTTYWHSIILES